MGGWCWRTVCSETKPPNTHDRFHYAWFGEVVYSFCSWCFTKTLLMRRRIWLKPLLEILKFSWINKVVKGKGKSAEGPAGHSRTRSDTCDRAMRQVLCSTYLYTLRCVGSNWYIAFSPQPWHLVPQALSWPSSSFSKFGGFSCHFTIDHKYFVWNISTIFTTAVRLPACVPAKLPCFTEVLRGRNLALPSRSHGQNLSWTVVSCITYQQSHIWINTLTCLHTHKQMVDGENRRQQGENILPQQLIVQLSFQSTLESTRLPLTWHVLMNYIIATVSTHMPSLLDASSHRKLGFSHCMVILASWPNGHWLPTRSYPLLPSVLIHPFANSSLHPPWYLWKCLISASTEEVWILRSIRQLMVTEWVRRWLLTAEREVQLRLNYDWITSWLRMVVVNSF